jgi:benzoyl-CoA reductase/2-hydroxyglutaryl-CoA dehydratase subunit BcrC/BadD/HgdB
MASRMLPTDAFEPRLKALLSAPAAPAGPRIVIAGSSHDDAGLHGLIESAGGCVVGDAHGSGEPGIGEPIDTAPAPMEALAAHYRATRAGARAFADAAADVLSFAKVARADGVIFSYFPEEEALTWDYPEQAVALARAGIAAIRIGPQARPFDAGGQAEIEAFIGSLGAAA